MLRRPNQTRNETFVHIKIDLISLAVLVPARVILTHLQSLRFHYTFPWRVKLPGLPYLNNKETLAVSHCWEGHIMGSICALTSMNKTWLSTNSKTRLAHLTGKDEILAAD